jgi:hypothetical protein
VADLRLGPLPRQRTVRLPIVLSEPLKEELDAYAAEHSRLYDQPVETAELIPHILETFLRTIAPGAATENRCSRRKPVNVELARPLPQT